MFHIRFLTLSLAATLAFSNVVQAKMQQVTYSSKAEFEASKQVGINRIAQAYVQPANIKNCKPAKMMDTERKKALDEVNAIREKHGLQPVSYNLENDEYTANAALVMVANRTIGHYPSKSLKCYTNEAAIGSKESNLHITAGSSPALVEENFPKAVIDGLLIDEGVKSLGHRAWLLNPFLRSISFGRATDLADGYVDGAAVYVQDVHTQVDTAVDYVAYPYGQYQKAWFKHGWYMSFSAFFDKTDLWKNKNVDYSKVKIRVTDSQGKQLPVKQIAKQDKHYKGASAGLPNLLQWQVSGTKDHERYQVFIENVVVDGKVRNYRYWFEIM